MSARDWQATKRSAVQRCHVMNAKNTGTVGHKYRQDQEIENGPGSKSQGDGGINDDVYDIDDGATLNR